MASYDSSLANFFESYAGPNPEVLQIPEPEVRKQNGVRRPQQPKRFGRTKAQRRRDLSVSQRGGGYREDVVSAAIERRAKMRAEDEVLALEIEDCHA